MLMLNADLRESGAPSFSPGFGERVGGPNAASTSQKTSYVQAYNPAMRLPCAFCWILLLALPSAAQTKSDMGKLPDALPNRVEVRFAVDKKAVTCDQLSLKVKQGDQFLINGGFAAGFDLPPGVPKSPKPALDVTIGCEGYVWHFDRVPTAMLQRGWWFVGTDYPPFQGDFTCPKFANFQLIRYVQFVRNDGQQFEYYETVPRSAENTEGCGASR
jgi:hypothetical protein